MDLISSSQRAVPLSARKDLLCRQSTYMGHVCWIVKDPVKLKYFRLEPEQYELLQLLDGKKNLDEILAEFRRKCPTQRRTRSQIQQMALDLYQQGLAWSTRPGQGAAMNHRGGVQRWQQTKQTLKNVLFIRLPSFDPTWILNVGYGLAKWSFHPGVVIWALTMIIYSWVFMLAHATEIGNRLPALESLTTWQCTVSLWLVIGITKIFHELGHAFACRHAGGECHGIGIAFLVFSPCLYCDVSDSWTLRSKWQRMGIGLAGIYVELLIAAFAFFGWWHSQPGGFNQICFLTFVVSSISTLLFNLNPLLRLDGYYILADWLEIPNLRQKADKSLYNIFLGLCLGIYLETERLPVKTKLFFVLYSIASTIYKALLVFVICWILYAMLKPLRLEYSGLAVGVLSAVCGAAAWARRIRKSARQHHSQYGTLNRIRPCVSALLVVGLLVAAYLIPIPIPLKTTLQLEYANSQHVYAAANAQLAAIHVQPGQSVCAGQLLLELFNFDETERLNQLLTKKKIQEIELRKHKILVDAQQSAIAAENLQSINSEIADLQTQLQRLQVYANRDGVIVEPSIRRPDPGSKRKLPSWSGTPIDLLNVGCHLETGTQLFSLATSPEMHAKLRVDPLDVQGMQIGQQVRIRLNHLPQRTFTGTIERISSTSIGTGSEDRTVTLNKNNEIQDNQYLAIVRIDGDQSLLLPGLRGKAKVAIESRTAAEWIWRNVKSTFNFES